MPVKATHMSDWTNAYAAEKQERNPAIRNLQSTVEMPTTAATLTADEDFGGGNGGIQDEANRGRPLLERESFGPSPGVARNAGMGSVFQSDVGSIGRHAGPLGSAGGPARPSEQRTLFHKIDQAIQWRIPWSSR